MLVLISVVQQNALHNKLTRNGTNNQITTLGIYPIDICTYLQPKLRFSTAANMHAYLDHRIV